MIESRKIFVCGGGELNPKFHCFSRNLGRALMRQPHLTLMTQGLLSRREGTDGNDYIIAQAAKAQLEEMGVDPATRIQTILPEKPTSHVKRFEIGTVVVVPNTDARRRRYSATLTCDVMIAIGGGPTTADIVDLAWIAGKPILPIAATEGASLDAWNKYGEEIAEGLNLSRKEANDLRRLPADSSQLVELCIKIVNRVLRPQCFVAMPYEDHPLPCAYETIKAAVESKGYQAVRVDQEPTIGSITDTIWNDIRAAQIAVADLTGNNPNVYYEIGISHALGKPTLLIIHNDLGVLPERMPFNISHHRILAYGCSGSLKAQLDKYLQEFGT